MNIPAHKVIGDKGKPGQVVHTPDVTLNDYIARKTECCGNPLRGCQDCPPPKKLTLYEWLRTKEAVELEADIAEVAIVWSAALTQGKL